MRKEIDLTEEVKKALHIKAINNNMSLKKYIENVLLREADLTDALSSKIKDNGLELESYKVGGVARMSLYINLEGNRYRNLRTNEIAYIKGSGSIGNYIKAPTTPKH